MLPDWIRRLCPSYLGIGYGYYGGAARRWVDYTYPRPEPVDKMDEAFCTHDIALFHSNYQPDRLRKKLRELADHELAVQLRSDLRPYAYPFWGPTFNFLARLVFS